MTSVLQSPFIGIVAATSAATALVALHWLRTRPPQQRVATMLFWRAATPVRSQRFLWGALGRWGTLALLLAIAIALSLAATGWLGSGGRSGEIVVLIIDVDASHDGDQSRFNTALTQVRNELRHVAHAPVAIIANGVAPQLVSDVDDPPDLALQMLTHSMSDRASGSPGQALRLARSLLPASGGRVILYRDRPLAADAIPADLRDRLILRALPASSPSIAIVGATFRPTIAGGLLTINVAANAPHREAKLTAAFADGSTRDIPLVWSDENSALATFALTSERSDVSVRVESADGKSIGDRVRLRLPSRAPIRFRVDGDLNVPLLAALSVIGDLGPVASSTTSSIAVVQSLDDAPATNASDTLLLIVGRVDSADAGSPTELSLVRSTRDDLTRGLSLAGCVARSSAPLKLETGDRPLIRGGDGSCLAALRYDVNGRAIQARWSAGLFDGGSTLVRAPSFVLLLERVCRALAGDGSSEVIAVPLDRVIDDPTSTLARTGSDATLMSPMAIGDVVPSADSPPIASGRARPSFWYLALVIAFVGLLIETLLYGKRRIA